MKSSGSISPDAFRLVFLTDVLSLGFGSEINCFFFIGRCRSTSSQLDGESLFREELPGPEGIFGRRKGLGINSFFLVAGSVDLLEGDGDFSLADGNVWEIFSLVEASGGKVFSLNDDGEAVFFLSVEPGKVEVVLLVEACGDVVFSLAESDGVFFSLDEGSGVIVPPLVEGNGNEGDAGGSDVLSFLVVLSLETDESVVAGGGVFSLVEDFLLVEAGRVEAVSLVEAAGGVVSLLVLGASLVKTNGGVVL